MANSTRCVHDAQFKTKIVLEAIKGHKTLAQLSSEYGIHATQITNWKQQALEGLPSLFNGNSSSVLSGLEREEIEAPLFQRPFISADPPTQSGRRAVENDFLKKKLRTT